MSVSRRSVATRFQKLTSLSNRRLTLSSRFTRSFSTRTQLFSPYFSSLSSPTPIRACIQTAGPYTISAPIRTLLDTTTETTSQCQSKVRPDPLSLRFFFKSTRADLNLDRAHRGWKYALDGTVLLSTNFRSTLDREALRDFQVLDYFPRR